MKYFFLMSSFLFQASILGQPAPTAGTNFNPAQPYLNSCSQSDLLKLQGGVTAGDGANIVGCVLQSASNSMTWPTCPQTTTAIPNPQCKVNLATANDLTVSVSSYDLLNPLNVCSINGASGQGVLCVYNSQGNNIGTAQFKFDTTPNNVDFEYLLSGNQRIYYKIKDNKINEANYSPKYKICYATNSTVLLTTCATAETTSTQEGYIGGLENGESYYLKVHSTANNSTYSSISNPIIPAETQAFGKVYNGAENPFSWSGGCSQSNANSGTWISLLLLAFLLFFRTSYLIGILFCLPLFSEPGQNIFGITGAPYRPNLDNSTKTDGSKILPPFYTCMLNNKLTPLIGIETAWHLLDTFGSLQLGFGVAYTYAGGRALQIENKQPLCAQSNDSAALHMLLIKPELTYALDNWVDTIFLVPYVRTSLAAMSYFFTYQGSLDKSGNAKPIGAVFGWEAAAGLRLALDFLSHQTNYRHIYLSAELAYMPISNFYAQGLDFSPNWPLSGNPFMLNFGLLFEFN